MFRLLVIRHGNYYINRPEMCWGGNPTGVTDPLTYPPAFTGAIYCTKTTFVWFYGLDSDSTATYEHH